MKHLKKFNESNNHNDDLLKDYAQYLIDQYCSIHTNGGGGSVMYRLEQFCSEGRIKDLLRKNQSESDKISMLNVHRDDIYFYAKSIGKDIKVDKYEEWAISKNRDKKIKSILHNENKSDQYFFTKDESSHWYMIPVSMKKRWNELIARGEDDEEANDLIDSEFGKYRTGGGISNISFENPKKV